MPKVKASKNRVHHKAVGNKDAATASTTSATLAKAVASFESQQQLKELGLEQTADKKEDKRKQRHDKWISSRSPLWSAADSWKGIVGVLGIVVQVICAHQFCWTF
jgi:hypothetical protein